MGAGSVGCYLGAGLQHAGATVHFVGRAALLQRLREHGLRTSDLDGRSARIVPTELRLHETPPTLERVLVLLTVKSAATREAARQLAQALPAGTPVLSLQNGIGNADAARQAAPALDVIAGMVPFNVAEVERARFHRGTSGVLAAAAHPALAPWLPLFERAGLSLALHADMRGVLWAKLLLNLNNPVNALAGLPLREELLIRGYRTALAALQSEALRVLDAARIEPARLTPLPAHWMPWVLRLPTPLFRLVAARTLRIDAKARSSMADDVAHGRGTEIDQLCGEVLRLARGLGLQAPANERAIALVRDLAVAPRRYSAKQLLAALAA
jgi:2-dehydropantoate 2-reductase